MKKLLLALPLIFTSALSFASSGSPYIDVMINSNTCDLQGNTCVIEEYGITAECTGSLKVTSSKYLYCEYGSMHFKSTKYPFVGVSSYYFPMKKNEDGFEVLSSNQTASRNFVYNFSFTDEFSIVENDESYYYYIAGFKLQKSIHNSVFNVASSLNNLLFDSYNFIHAELEKFKRNIKKSDIGHTKRLQNALEEGMGLLSAKDDNNELLYSALDWRVQENSRLIIAFGSIMDELLTEYDHVETIKNAIENMRSLVKQLRRSYGWDRNGLSGTVSKASSTLLEVISLEVRELGAIRMSLGESTAEFSEILKVTSELKAKVDAANSGDMRAQREMWYFLDAWNDDAWQAELDKLVNAGPDVRGIVTPKLNMLIQAMESIEELSDAGFKLPTIE